MFADTLAWALAQVAGTRARVLADAYTSGTRKVTFENRTVEYATLAEMERALSALYAASVSTTQRRPARTIAVIGGGS
ncbi:MAG: hypothetical protein ING00_17540 [Roseomonas sp.]|jgi:hypothetical protein|nr:hypothetical protein [Roseomonas sp.]